MLCLSGAYNRLLVRFISLFYGPLRQLEYLPPAPPNLPLPQMRKTDRGRLSSRPHTSRLQNGRYDGRIQHARKKGDGKLHLSSLILRRDFKSAVCFEIACDLLDLGRCSVGSYSCMRWTSFVFRAAEWSWKGMVKVRHFLSSHSCLCLPCFVDLYKSFEAWWFEVFVGRYQLAINIIEGCFSKFLCPN